MDLNKLRSFTVVAECGSITAAAERLYRTQPAISNQLKDLELETGLVLFERKHGRIFLTREGQSLFEKAKAHIRDLDDAVQRLRSEKHSIEGTIRLAVEQDTVSHMLPRLINAFTRECPRVLFDVVAARYGEMEDMLLDNRVDFALMVLYDKREFFVTHPYTTFSRSLMAAPDFIQRYGPITCVADVFERPFIGFASSLGDIRFWLRKNGYSRLISQCEKQLSSMVVSDASMMNAMLCEGVGSGFAFDHMLEDNCELVELFPGSKPMRITVDLVERKVQNERYLNQTFREFVLGQVNGEASEP